MISSSKFFQLEPEEMFNYLDNRLPAPAAIAMTDNSEDYVALVKDFLGISGDFKAARPIRSRRKEENGGRIAKKGTVLVDLPRLGNEGEFISFTSECFGINICISGIFTCHSHIDINVRENK